MAQIKKLQNAGTIPTPSAPKVDRSEIKKGMWDKFYSMSVKDQKRAYDEYKQVESLIDTDAFGFKPNREFYVDKTKLPENLKNLDWCGHQGLSLDKGFLGAQGYVHGKIFDSKEDRNAERSNRGLSSAMADVRDLMETKNASSPLTSESIGSKRVIPSLSFIVGQDYSGNLDLASKKILEKTEEQKGIYLADKLGNLLNYYIDSYNSNQASGGKDIYDPEDLKKINELKTIYTSLKSGNVTDFKQYSAIFDKLGIDTSDYFKTPETLKAAETAKTAAEASDILENNIKNLASIYGEEAARNLASKGYEYMPGHKFNIKEADDLVSKNRGIVLKRIDPLTKNPIFEVYDEKLNPIKGLKVGNQFSENYLTSWFNDPTKGFIYQHGNMPDNASFMELLNEYKIKNPNIESNIGKQLITNLQPGLKVQGWSNEENGKYSAINDPIYGKRRDYTAHIVVTNEKGTKREYKKDPNKPGYYIDSMDHYSKKLPFIITGFGDDTINIQSLNIPEKFKNVRENALFGDNYDDKILSGETKKELDNLEDWVVNNQGAYATDITSDTYDNVNKIIRSWVNVYNRSIQAGNQEKKLEALQRLNELSGIIDAYNSKQATAKKILFNKSGGSLIKLENGGDFSKFAKYRNRISSSSQRESSQTDISGLLRGSSNLDKVILGANATSLLPGIPGVIGGTIATGAELIRDMEDPTKSGWEVGGNALLNIGFTAASAFGGGFLKGALKGLQTGEALAKTTLKAEKIAEAALKAEKVTEGAVDASKVAKNVFKTTSAEKEMKVSLDAINKFAAEKGLNNASIKEIAKAAESLGEGGKDIAKHLATVKSFSETYAKNSSLINIAVPTWKKVGETVGNIGQLAGVVRGVMAVPGAINAGKTIMTDPSEMTISDINDVLSVAFAGKIGTRHAGKFIGKKYGTVVASEEPAKITATIKGKEVDIEDADIIGKIGKDPIKDKVKFWSTSNKQAKEAIVAKLNAGKPTTEHITLKDISKVETTKAKVTGLNAREKIDIDKNHFLQKLAINKKLATRYGLVSAPMEKSSNQNTSSIPSTKTENSKEVVKRFRSKEALRQRKNSIDYKNLAKVTVKTKPVKKFTEERHQKALQKLSQRLSNKLISQGALDPTQQNKNELPKLNPLKKSSKRELLALTWRPIAPKGAKSSMTKLKNSLDKITEQDKRNIIYSKIAKLENTYRFKQGGIVKYENPTTPLNYKNDYSNILDDKTNTYQNIISHKKANTYSVPKQHRTSANFYGGVTPELIQKNWDPNILNNAFKGTAEYKLEDTKTWGNNISETLQKYVQGNPELYNQIKNKNSLQFGHDWYSVGINPVAKTKVDTPIITPNTVVKDPEPKLETGTTNRPPAKKPWDWGKIDVNDLGNTAMYLNTRMTNKNVAQAQMTTPALRSLLPNQNIVNYNPYDRKETSVKAEANTLGNRTAGKFSDSNKQLLFNLALFEKGEAAAAGYREKGTELYNKGIQAQNTSNYNTQVKNIGIADYNIAAIKQTNDANGKVTAAMLAGNGNAFNNLTKGFLLNKQVRDNKKDYTALYDLQTGDEYKGLKTAASLWDQTAENKILEAYKTEKTNIGTTPELEDWGKYKVFKAGKESYQKSLEDYYEKMNNLKLKYQYGLQKPGGMFSAKSGGKLSKQDKIDIENVKANRKQEQDSIKEFYKAISENNKLVQKSISELFKK